VILLGVLSVVCGWTNTSGILSASPRCFTGKFRWNLQLHLPPRVEFTLCFLAGNTTKCSSKPAVVFPYFTMRKYHPGGILGTTRKYQNDCATFLFARAMKPKYPKAKMAASNGIVFFLS
jgi:hypothetical protein